MNKYIFISIGIVIVGIVGAIFLLQNRSLQNVSGGYVSSDVAELADARLMEVVELRNGDIYDLTASYVKKNINGKEYRMLAYNGSIPGPLIKIVQGSELTINFKNDMDMPTLLHSHGVRMDNAFDGSQVTQEEMEPGETFSYKLKFPDAGMYWYHPHVREDFEQELGLYGNFLVVPADSDYWSPVNREVALFLDDILIEDGRIALSKKGADHTLMGRFGNVMLVNGETDYSLSVKKGEVIRFYITNSANTRPFNFAILGSKIKLVGADGGAYEKDQWTDAVTLGPSERAVIEVLFENSGTFAMQNKTPNKTYALGTIVVGVDPVDVSYSLEFNQLRTHGETSASIVPLRQYFDKAPDKQIKLSIDMGGNMMNMMEGSMMSSEGGIEWEDENEMMNQMSDADSVRWKVVDQATGKENMDINWTFKRGELVKIRITNDAHSMHPMQHPMHFHGQRFLVLERDGNKETNLAWKDTVLVKAGETVDILMDTSNSGTWMAHCHIAEHLEAGMMMKFEVET